METVQRPTGVTLLALLAFLFGVGGGFGAWSILAGAGILGARGVNLAGAVGAYGLLLLGTSALQLAFAYGVWTVRRWAWPLGIVLQGLALALALLYILLGAGFTGQLLTIIPPAIILGYLLTPGARQAFGKA